MENNKGQTIFLSVVGIATLLVAIVGATFAYFSISVKGNEGASSIIVNTTTLTDITFQDGSEISLPNAYPGEKVTKTFTISTDNSKTITSPVSYDVYLNVDKNTFAALSPNDLAQWIVCPTGLTGSSCSTVEAAAGTSEATAVTVSTTAGSRVKIATGTFDAETQGLSHTLTYGIIFKETNTDQNSQQGQEFTGRIQVEVTGGTKYTAGGAIYSN